MVQAPIAAPPRRPRGRSRLWLALGAVLIIAGGAGAGAGLGALLRDPGAGPVATPAPSPSVAPSTQDSVLPATVSSVDPSGGSGLRDRDGTWTTQTYTTAAFGGLKPGVGLLLDLGQPRPVTSVAFEAGPAPLLVELRAGDDPAAAPDGFAPVSAPADAEGATTLDGSGGGAHRYWLVWVSSLGATGEGFRATLSTPVVRGPG